MGKIFRLPGKDNFQVKCQVSDRRLDFNPYSASVNHQEFISLKVMTHSYASDSDRRLCDLVVTRADLERVLKLIKLRDSE